MTEQSASLVEHMPIGWTDVRGLRSAPEQDVLPAHIPGHQEGDHNMMIWMSVRGRSTLALIFCCLSMRYQASGICADSIIRQTLSFLSEYTCLWDTQVLVQQDQTVWVHLGFHLSSIHSTIMNGLP